MKILLKLNAVVFALSTFVFSLNVLSANPPVELAEDEDDKAGGFHARRTTNEEASPFLKTLRGTAERFSQMPFTNVVRKTTASFETRARGLLGKGKEEEVTKCTGYRALYGEAVRDLVGVHMAFQYVVSENKAIHARQEMGSSEKISQEVAHELKIWQQRFRDAVDLVNLRALGFYEGLKSRLIPQLREGRHTALDQLQQKALLYLIGKHTTAQMRGRLSACSHAMCRTVAEARRRALTNPVFALRHEAPLDKLIRVRHSFKPHCTVREFWSHEEYLYIFCSNDIIDPSLSGVSSIGYIFGYNTNDFSVRYTRFSNMPPRNMLFGKNGDVYVMRSENDFNDFKVFDKMLKEKPDQFPVSRSRFQYAATDGETMAVSDIFGLHIVDMGTNELQRTVDIGFNPTAFVFQDGKIYATQEDTTNVAIYDLATNDTTRVTLPFPAFDIITKAKNGILLNAPNGRIVHVDKGGKIEPLFHCPHDGLISAITTEEYIVLLSNSQITKLSADTHEELSRVGNIPVGPGHVSASGNIVFVSPGRCLHLFNMWTNAYRKVPKYVENHLQRMRIVGSRLVSNTRKLGKDIITLYNVTE